MIPTFQQIAICAGLATVMWTVIGLAVARRLTGEKQLAWAVAPVLGFAVHSAAALPLLTWFGLTRFSVIAGFAVPVIGGVLAMWRQHDRGTITARDVAIAGITVVAAALLAYAIAAAVVPHVTSSGVTLAAPIFDHSKIAMIDDMMRVGLPAGNPFFGQTGDPQRLSYYYLWHFAAAELGILAATGGWAADAAITWFTAFASLVLMMGLSCWISGRRAAAAWVLLVAATWSIRPVLAPLFGWGAVNAATGPATGFGTWLFQTTWAPQHVMSAACAVVAVVVILQVARTGSLLAAIALGLLAAASFETSTWVGGAVFPMLAVIAAAIGWPVLPAPHRRRYIALIAGAGILTIALAAPFVNDQLQMSTLRADGFPIAVTPFDVLSDEIPAQWRRWLDIPAYWTLFLFTEFVAFYPMGLIAAIWLRNDRQLPAAQRRTAVLFGISAIVSLAAAGLLKSTIAPNNDLGWRAALPAIVMLIVLTGAALGRYIRGARRILCFGGVGLTMLGLSTGWVTIQNNFQRIETASSVAFLRATGMWEAARRHTGPRERVANNPDFLGDMTNWPVNISWALLSNRRSCYAGRELALPFAPVSRLARQQIGARFARVFAGQAEPDDLAALADQYDCATVVLTPGDGAWRSDPFDASPHYHLVEQQPGAWRIYRRQPRRTH